MHNRSKPAVLKHRLSRKHPAACWLGPDGGVLFAMQALMHEIPCHTWVRCWMPATAGGGRDAIDQLRQDASRHRARHAPPPTPAGLAAVVHHRVTSSSESAWHTAAALAFVVKFIAWHAQRVWQIFAGFWDLGFHDTAEQAAKALPSSQLLQPREPHKLTR